MVRRWDTGRVGFRLRFSASALGLGFRVEGSGVWV